MNTGFITDVAIGAAVGAVSQVADNYDAKSGQTKWYKKYGTWVAFGIPALGIAAEFVNLPLDKKWTDKALLAGSVLAGAKIVQLMTAKNYKLTYSSAASYNGARAWAPANRSAAPGGPSAYNVISNSEVMV
jgi:hypothetical protein